MDLLTGYGSEDDDVDKHMNPEPPVSETGIGVASTALGVSLPNPFADETVEQQSSSATKRSFPAVSGHSVAANGSKGKFTKLHASATPASAKTKLAGAMLPPQLTGRANVVTEDIEKLFTRKGPHAQGAGSTSSRPNSVVSGVCPKPTDLSNLSPSVDQPAAS